MTNQIEFLKSGEWVMRITADRRIEVNEDVTVTESAQAVLEAVQKLLEQQVEPVAWMFQHEETGRIMCVEAQQVEGGFEKGNPRLKKIAPLYTHPPQRKPLTDDMVHRAMIALNTASCGEFQPTFDEMKSALEAAHGIGEKP